MQQTVKHTTTSETFQPLSNTFEHIQQLAKTSSRIQNIPPKTSESTTKNSQIPGLITMQKDDGSNSLVAVVEYHSCIPVRSKDLSTSSQLVSLRRPYTLKNLACRTFRHEW